MNGWMSECKCEEQPRVTYCRISHQTCPHSRPPGRSSRLGVCSVRSCRGTGPPDSAGLGGGAGMSDPGAAHILQLLTKAPTDWSSSSKEEAPARVPGNLICLRSGRLVRHMTDVPRVRWRITSPVSACLSGTDNDITRPSELNARLQEQTEWLTPSQSRSNGDRDSRFNARGGDKGHWGFSCEDLWLMEPFRHVV